MIPSKQVTVLSLEQALALPYATERFVQMGWRVIRIETPAENPGENAGDPNRYIGADLGHHDLHSYYITPNLGKEAITLNLKKKEGQELLLKIIRELKVDVFMCNTLPKRYQQLGIDFKTLSAANKDIIWCGISAIGPDYPDRAGYDPALQALMGFTYLTGEVNGKPVPSGIPVIDLKAGDEAVIQVLKAMWEKEQGEIEMQTGTTGLQNGKEIHISMAQCAASWLITALPQLAFVKSDNELFQRSGNEHRSFIPCNVYTTKDGMIYLAIGNDLQWEKFTAFHGFGSLACESRRTNAGRMLEKDAIYTEIEALTQKYTTDEFFKIGLSLNLSVAPVNTVKQVAELDFVKKTMLHTTLPDGRSPLLAPPSHATLFLEKSNNHLSCAPRLGEQNEKVWKEIGLTDVALEKLKKVNAC